MKNLKEIEWDGSYPIEVNGIFVKDAIGIQFLLEDSNFDYFFGISFDEIEAYMRTLTKYPMEKDDMRFKLIDKLINYYGEDIIENDVLRAISEDLEEYIEENVNSTYTAVKSKKIKPKSVTDIIDWIKSYRKNKE